MTGPRTPSRVLALGVVLATPCLARAGATTAHAKEARGWGFRVIHAQTRALEDEDALGVENSRDGRGFYRSAPISVTPGKRYDFSVACRTESAPAQCAFARVFWYQGPDRGRQSTVRRLDDTIAVGGTTGWTVLTPSAPLIVPEDATVAVLRLESHSPKAPREAAEQVALAGRTVYQLNWHSLLKRKGVTFRNCGDWLDPGEFGKHKLVILCNAGPGRKLSDAENDTIRRCLEGGGHLILTISTPYNLAGGKDVRSLRWLGATQCRYGHLGEEFTVLDNSDRLTEHLAVGDSVYTTSGKVAGLGLAKGSGGLVGSGAYRLIVTRAVGEGRVTFFGNSPPAGPGSQPVFQGIIERTLAEAGLEGDTERTAKRFSVWFKDVVFLEVEE